MLGTHKYVRIKNGPHVGREGFLVSYPWIGNLWHTWVVVNVAANAKEICMRYWGWGEEIVKLFDNMKKGFGPREWLIVRYRDIEEIKNV